MADNHWGLGRIDAAEPRALEDDDVAAARRELVESTAALPRRAADDEVIRIVHHDRYRRNAPAHLVRGVDEDLVLVAGLAVERAVSGDAKRKAERATLLQRKRRTSSAAVARAGRDVEQREMHALAIFAIDAAPPRTKRRKRRARVCHPLVKKSTLDGVLAHGEDRISQYGGNASSARGAVGAVVFARASVARVGTRGVVDVGKSALPREVAARVAAPRELGPLRACRAHLDGDVRFVTGGRPELDLLVRPRLDRVQEDALAVELEAMPTPARAERRAAQLDEELPGVRRPTLGLREHDARVRDLWRRVVDADSLGARLEQRRARSGSQAVRHMQGCRALESRLHYDDDFARADRNDAERRIAPLHAERMSVLLRVLVRELATDNREPSPPRRYAVSRLKPEHNRSGVRERCHVDHLAALVADLDHGAELPPDAGRCATLELDRGPNDRATLHLEPAERECPWGSASGGRTGRMRRVTHSVPVGPSETDVMVSSSTPSSVPSMRSVSPPAVVATEAPASRWMLVMDGRAVEVAGATERNPATVSLHCTRMPTGPAGVRHAIRLCASTKEHSLAGNHGPCRSLADSTRSRVLSSRPKLCPTIVTGTPPIVEAPWDPCPSKAEMVGPAYPNIASRK